MATDLAIKEPVLRWSARAHSIAEVEIELARIWAGQDLATDVDGQPGRHIAAMLWAAGRPTQDRLLDG